MNLLFRLFWLVLTTRWRPPTSFFGPVRTAFRVWPTDLDLLRHVNNGVFLSLMDLGRVDLMLRGGMARLIRRQGWYPVVVAETIQFRRSLTLFQRFVIETRLVGWDEKALLLEQHFERDSEIIATALVRARFLSRAGNKPVSPAQIMAVANLPAASPDLPAYADRWNTDAAVWRHSRGP